MRSASQMLGPCSQMAQQPANLRCMREHLLFALKQRDRIGLQILQAIRVSMVATARHVSFHAGGHLITQLCQAQSLLLQDSPFTAQQLVVGHARFCCLEFLAAVKSQSYHALCCQHVDCFSLSMLWSACRITPALLPPSRPRSSSVGHTPAQSWPGWTDVRDSGCSSPSRYALRSCHILCDAWRHTHVSDDGLEAQATVADSFTSSPAALHAQKRAAEFGEFASAILQGSSPHDQA